MNSSSSSSSSSSTVGVQPALPFAPNTTSISSAFASQTLGVGFSGTGFLILYEIGVLAVLRSLGIINGATKLAGASGGSLVAAAACSGASNVFQTSFDITVRCRASMGCRGSLDSVVRAALPGVLPPDAAQRCSSRLFVAVTEARPDNQTDPGLLLGPNWPGNAALEDALATSSFIPIQSGLLVTPALASQGIAAAYDGGFTQSLPVPPNVSYAITVSANPPRPRSATTNESSEVAAFLAQLAVSANNTPANLTAYLPLNPVPVASTPQPDVYPGLGGRLRVSTAEWNGFSLQIPNDTVLLYIFDTGRADAAAFAGASGLVTPSAIQAALDNTVALTSNGTRQ